MLLLPPPPQPVVPCSLSAGRFSAGPFAAGDGRDSLLRVYGLSTGIWADDKNEINGIAFDPIVTRKSGINGVGAAILAAETKELTGAILALVTHVNQDAAIPNIKAKGRGVVVGAVCVSTEDMSGVEIGELLPICPLVNFRFGGYSPESEDPLEREQATAASERSKNNDASSNSATEQPQELEPPVLRDPESK